MFTAVLFEMTRSAFDVGWQIHQRQCLRSQPRGQALTADQIHESPHACQNPVQRNARRLAVGGDDWTRRRQPPDKHSRKFLRPSDRAQPGWSPQMQHQRARRRLEPAGQLAVATENLYCSCVRSLAAVELAAVVPVVYLVARLPISAAGIGVEQGGFAYAATWLGLMAHAPAAAISFLVSPITLLIALLPGLAAWVRARRSNAAG